MKLTDPESCRAVMALIRGVQGLYPCPICLIPSQDLANINITAPLRDMEETQHLVAESVEANLKGQGLRPVEVKFVSLFMNQTPFDML